MAKAPKPTGPKDKRRPVIEITVRGVEAIVDPGEFGPKDDILVRRESLAAFGERVSLIGSFESLDQRSAGLDTICLLWWLARRKAGDTTESLSDALDGFPSYAEADSEITFDIIEDAPLPSGGR